MDSEEWRPVVGWEDRYEVSSQGRVRSARDSQQLRIRIIPKAYLSRGSKLQAFSVSRLVAEAFVGPRPSPRHEVLHGDGVEGNNTPGNLRWGTRRENMADAKRHGTLRNGNPGLDHSSRQVISRQEVELIRHFALVERISPSAIAPVFGLKAKYVRKIVSGEVWLS